jgi:CRP-like cAMP-binding protein
MVVNKMRTVAMPPRAKTLASLRRPGSHLTDSTDAGERQAHHHHHESAVKSSYGKDSIFHQTVADSAQQQALKNRALISELRITKRIFHNFDADGSGSIDVHELRAVMEAMGHSLADAQLEELVEQVDADGSGDISFEEFVQLINIWKEANQFKLFKSAGASLQDKRIEDAKRVRMFLPDQKIIVAWHIVVLVCITYTFLITGYLITTASENDDGTFEQVREAVLVSDILASVVFALDIIVSFLTAVRVSLNGPNRTVVIDNPEEVAKRYICSPWLWIDLLAVPPTLRVLPRDQVYFALVFIVMKAFKIPKLFNRSGKQKMTPTYVYLHFYLIPVIRVCVYFGLAVHSIAVSWTLISIATASSTSVTMTPGAPMNATNVSLGLGVSTVPLWDDPSVKSVQSDVSYITSLYFVLYTLTTAGFGDIVIDGSNARIIFAMILCVCGTLLNGLVIGSIVSILSKTDIDKERENKLRETLAVCEYFDVPVGLAEEVLNFQNHLLADSLSEAYSDLVMGLPSEMKLNINLFTRVDLISSVYLFRDAHQGAKVAIASLLTSAVFRPEETVVVAGEHGDCMYFIGYGFVDVLSRTGRHLAILKRGNFFGEGALLETRQTRNATVKAITYCDLFVLSRPNFESVLRRFPRFKRAIIETSKQRAHAAAAAATADVGTDGSPRSRSLMKKESFIHERLEKQDAIDEQIAKTNELMQQLLVTCADHVNQMEAMVSDLNRQATRTSGRTNANSNSLSVNHATPVLNASGVNMNQSIASASDVANEPGSPTAAAS